MTHADRLFSCIPCLALVNQVWISWQSDLCFLFQNCSVVVIFPSNLIFLHWICSSNTFCHSLIPSVLLNSTFPSFLEVTAKVKYPLLSSIEFDVISVKRTFEYFISHKLSMLHYLIKKIAHF